MPIVVAINKIDKPEAKPERVKQELTEHGLVASEWGGDITMVEVSDQDALTQLVLSRIHNIEGVTQTDTHLVYKLGESPTR